MRQILLTALAIIFVASFAGVAGAQTGVVINPTIIEFTVSADHTTLDLNGNPLVARYEVRIFVGNETTPLQVFDIGKPTPNASGKVTILNPVWFAALTPNTVFRAKVAAIGPVGEGVSDYSNPFGNQLAPRGPGTVVIR